jgi:hypothetical protein
MISSFLFAPVPSSSRLLTSMFECTNCIYIAQLKFGIPYTNDWLSPLRCYFGTSSTTSFIIMHWSFCPLYVLSHCHNIMLQHSSLILFSWKFDIQLRTDESDESSSLISYNFSYFYEICSDHHASINQLSNRQHIVKCFTSKRITWDVFSIHLVNITSIFDHLNRYKKLNLYTVNITQLTFKLNYIYKKINKS